LKTQHTSYPFSKTFFKENPFFKAPKHDCLLYHQQRFQNSDLFLGNILWKKYVSFQGLKAKVADIFDKKRHHMYGI
jgi:hypothetical protein